MTVCSGTQPLTMLEALAVPEASLHPPLASESWVVPGDWHIIDTDHLGPVPPSTPEPHGRAVFRRTVRLESRTKIKKKHAVCRLVFRGLVGKCIGFCLPCDNSSGF